MEYRVNQCILCKEPGQLVCKCQLPRLTLCNSCLTKHEYRNPGSQHITLPLVVGACHFCFERSADLLCLCSDPPTALCNQCTQPHTTLFQNFPHAMESMQQQNAIALIGASKYLAEKAKVAHLQQKLSDSRTQLEQLQTDLLLTFDKLVARLNDNKQTSLTEIQKATAMLDEWQVDLEEYLLTGKTPTSVISQYLQQVPETLVVCEGEVNSKVLEEHIASLGRVWIHPSFEAVRPGTARPVLNETEKTSVVLRVNEHVENLAHCYFVLGSSACNRGDYSESQEYYENAILIWERLVQRESESLANCYEGLAGLYATLQDLEVAKSKCQHAVDMKSRVLGDQHPGLARTCLQLGNIERQLGCPVAAKAMYKRALRLRSALSKTHLDNAAAYFSIGNLYYDQGQYPKAKKYLERALTLHEELLGPAHNVVARTLLALGNVYLELGLLDEAHKAYSRSLSIRIKTLGEVHEEVGSCYAGLANLMLKNAKLLEAKEYYQKSMHIREQTLGLEHPDTASAYYSLGALYSETGDTNLAQEYVDKALAIRIKKLGEGHPDIARCFHTLGLIHRKTGKLPEARNYFQQALRIRRTKLGPGHPATASSLVGLGSVLQAEGGLPEAKQVLQEALGIRVKKYGPDHAEVADALMHLAVVEKEAGDYATAVRNLEEALRIRSHCYGPTHAISKNTRHLLNRMTTARNKQLVK